MSTNFRIIPRLEIKNNFLIKGMHMEGLKKIGNPIEFAKIYSKKKYHEIFYEDVVASLYNREIKIDLVKKISEVINIPLTVCGGIKKLNQMERLFNSGADKICINSVLFKNFELLKNASNMFGSQSIGVLIQFKKIGSNFEVFAESGRERTGIFLLDWISKIQSNGAGEIFLCSIDNDGVDDDINYEILEKASNICKIPIHYGGGINNLQKLNFLKKNFFSGVLISKSLHNKTFRII